MGALLIFHKHRNAACQFLQNEHALLDIADGKEFLHHVVGVLVGD